MHCTVKSNGICTHSLCGEVYKVTAYVVFLFVCLHFSLSAVWYSYIGAQR